jgi:hypothetical protein
MSVCSVGADELSWARDELAYLEIRFRDHRSIIN